MDAISEHLSIYVYTYRCMRKKIKVTLSLDKEIVERIWSELSRKETLSGVVEKSLEGMSSNAFLEKLASLLEIDGEIMSPKEILRKRGRGARAEVVVREIRDDA